MEWNSWNCFNSWQTFNFWTKEFIISIIFHIPTLCYCLDSSFFNQNFHILESHYHPVYFTGSFHKLPTFASTSFKIHVYVFFASKPKKRSKQQGFTTANPRKCICFQHPKGCITVSRFLQMFFVRTKRKVVQGPRNKVTAQTVSKLSSKRAKCKAKLRSSVPKPLDARWERTALWRVTDGLRVVKVMGGFFHVKKTQNNRFC